MITQALRKTLEFCVQVQSASCSHTLPTSRSSNYAKLLPMKRQTLWRHMASLEDPGLCGPTQKLSPFKLTSRQPSGAAEHHRPAGACGILSKVAGSWTSPHPAHVPKSKEVEASREGPGSSEGRGRSVYQPAYEVTKVAMIFRSRSTFQA